MRSRMLWIAAMVGMLSLVGCSKKTVSPSATAPPPSSSGSSAMVLPPAPPEVLPLPEPKSSTTVIAADPLPAKPAAAKVAKAAKSADSAASKDKATASADGKKYVVKKGDTLSKIAKANYGDVKQVKQIALANNISDPNKIRAGQVLVLP